MGKRRTLITYERRIVGTALLAVLPLAAAAALLVWVSELPSVVTWTVAMLIVIAIAIATAALHEVVSYPLRTLANVVSAMREEGYSVRAREAGGGPIFGDILTELNTLSETMSQREAASLEAAALVRTVIAEVDAAIFAFDSAERLELVNRAGARLFDSSADALVGRTAAELSLADLMVEDEESRTVERTVGSTEGRWSVRVTVFRREGQSHRLLVLGNISRALRQEEIRAWQRVVRVLGHELNNSLAPIMSIAGSLEEALAAAPHVQACDETLHAKLTRGLGVIGRRSDSLTRFLSAYSELARLPQPTIRSVELEAVVRRAVALDHRLDVTVTGGPPLRVAADEDQLEQVIINLVKNAIDAALATDGEVSVAWRAAGDAAELAIVDSGPGLASSANLFVPFFTTKPSGSGIGLVLSRQIAEAHGGTLTLRNRADARGCESIVRLPLSEGADARGRD